MWTESGLRIRLNRFFGYVVCLFCSFCFSPVQQYHDWAGRCSSWCECSSAGNASQSQSQSSQLISCHHLGCMADVMCEARHTTIGQQPFLNFYCWMTHLSDFSSGFGQRLYLEDRGVCQCHDGVFICDTSELMPDLEPGLYITLGYSKPELDLIRENVPKGVLERSGLISQSSSFAKDLITRLQFALEHFLSEVMMKKDPFWTFLHLEIG